MLILVRRSFFFFSSRRRYTRFKCDWSSDVCSSDLAGNTLTRRSRLRTTVATIDGQATRRAARGSGERRVGKECRSPWSPYHLKKKTGKRCSSESMAPLYIPHVVQPGSKPLY